MVAVIEDNLALKMLRASCFIILERDLRTRGAIVISTSLIGECTLLFSNCFSNYAVVRYIYMIEKIEPVRFDQPPLKKMFGARAEVFSFHILKANHGSPMKSVSDKGLEVQDP